MAIDRYRPDIEGLRAVAVLMVLVFHFDLLPFSGGFAGVDVFFVISGYLITSIIFRRMEANDFSLLEFYTNRIRRLAPALFVTNLLVVATGLALLFPYELIALAKQIIAAQSYTANLYYWRSFNYFGLPAQSAFLLHTWSLAVEEQFYLLYPLAFLLAYRYARQYLWHLVIGCLLASFLLNVVFVSLKPEATFYLLPTRAWELLAGAALVQFRGTSFNRLTREGLSGLGILCVLVALVGYSSKYQFPGYFALLPTAGAAMIIAMGGGRGTCVGTILSTRAFNYIGRISYPLYLVHWPLKVFVEQQFAVHVFPVRVAEFAVSIALAALIYELVERRVIRNAGLSRRRILVGYASGLAVALSVAWIAILGRGLPFRFPEEAIRLADFVRDKTPELPECEFRGQQLSSFADFCRIGNRTEAPSWLIYGDSHAWAAYGAFDQWLSERNETGLFIFRHQCLPVAGVDVGRDGSCRTFNSRVLAFVKNSAVKNVLLVSSWREVNEGLVVDDLSHDRSIPSSIKLFRKAFPNTVQQISHAGKNIVVWEPVPGARESVPQGLAKLAMRGRPASAHSIEFSDSEYRESVSYFFDAMQSVSSIAQAFSPERALCRSGMCSALIGTSPAYFDNGHITASTRSFWAQQLRQQITLVDAPERPSHGTNSASPD